MKNTKIIYWVFTILFAGMMLFSAIPDLMRVPDAITIMKDQLGYPLYLIRFIGLAKLLGGIAILVPGLSRIKEWAYAGLAFDLIGATYSTWAINGFVPQLCFMLLPIVLGAGSYIYYHKLLKEKRGI